MFAARGSATVLQHESDMRDIALDEAVEINMGDSPDVWFTLKREGPAIDPAQTRLPVPVPGMGTPPPFKDDDVALARVDITNARPTPVQFELRLQLNPGGRVVHADHPLGSKNGRPMFA